MGNGRSWCVNIAVKRDSLELKKMLRTDKKLTILKIKWTLNLSNCLVYLEMSIFVKRKMNQ